MVLGIQLSQRAYVENGSVREHAGARYDAYLAAFALSSRAASRGVGVFRRLVMSGFGCALAKRCTGCHLLGCFLPLVINMVFDLYQR